MRRITLWIVLHRRRGDPAVSYQMSIDAVPDHGHNGEPPPVSATTGTPTSG